MRKILWLAFLWPTLAMGAQFEASRQVSRIIESTVANLPTGVISGTVRIVTDGNATNDCTAGGDTTRVLCQYNGSAWVALGDGAGSGSAASEITFTPSGGVAATDVQAAIEEVDSEKLASSTLTLDLAFDGGKSIDGANSAANAVQIGDGTNKWLIYRDSVEGLIIEPSTAANVRQRIQTNTTGGFYDVEGAADIFTIDPDAANTNAMYTFGSGYRPRKSIYFDAGAINVDGTNCAVPTEQALNSSEKTWAFSCADSNSSIFSGKVKMPDSWDGSDPQFRLRLFHGTTESITFAVDVSAMCRGTGDAIDSTYGTAAASDVSITTANVIVGADATPTPNGTCTGGKFLIWRYVVDAANFSANAANAKILGVTIEYAVSSLSD